MALEYRLTISEKHSLIKEFFLELNKVVYRVTQANNNSTSSYKITYVVRKLGDFSKIFKVSYYFFVHY